MKSLNPLLAVSATLAIAAAACAAWFGYSWYSASHSSSLATARTRDLVLQSGEQAVINLNTLNYKQATQGLQLWLNSSTGGLHTGLASDLTAEEEAIEETERSTTARVLDGAVTALNSSAGTASIMVALDVSVTPAKGSPYTLSESELGQMERTPSGWKLSSLGDAPEPSSSTSSPAPTAPPTVPPSPTPTRSR
jgi:Mce-associated membrane protein